MGPKEKSKEVRRFRYYDPYGATNHHITQRSAGPAHEAVS